MKLGTVCGYAGIIQTIGYALLQKYGWLSFAPVLDQVLQVVCPAVGVAGAVVLHNAEPPAPKE